MLEVVRQAVETTMAAGQVPGIVLQVARSGQPIAQFCVGKDAEGRDLPPASLFPVASITKMATALAVLHIVDEGGAALDDPLALHVPEAVAAQHGVTLRTLLSH